MAIHEVEEGCVIFWCVRMAAFAISTANGVWFAEEIVNFLGRSRSSISTCGVRAMIFIGFCEQQSARGYECVQVVIVLGQFGIAIFMGRVSGKSMNNPGVQLQRIENGQVAEIRNYFDMLVILREFGALGAP
jgi:hypothetical protein